MRTLLPAILVIPFLLVSSSHAEGAPPAGKGYMGVRLQPITIEYPAHSGDKVGALGVSTVFPQRPAYRGGLRRGDVIVSIGGAGFPDAEAAERVRSVLSSTYPAGAKMKMEVLRGAQKIGLTVRTGSWPSLPTDKALHPKLFGKTDLYERLLSKILADQKWTGNYRTLVNTFAAQSRMRNDPFVSHRLLFAHREPLKVPALANQLTTQVVDAYRRAPGLSRVVARSGQWIGDGYAPLQLERLQRRLDGDGHLKQLIHVIEEAAEQAQGAFAGITPGEMEKAWNHMQAGAARGDPSVLLGGTVGMRTLLLNVDTDQLLQAAQRLALLDDAAYLQELRTALSRGLRRQSVKVKGVTGKVLLVKQTKVGRLIVGGSGPNTYDIDAAILIDLGGNDVYKRRPGALHRPGQGVGVCLDLGGNDRYVTDQSYAQGCGLLGVGLLVDVSGNDTYKAHRGSQGCGAIGVGMLVDRKGTDKYLLDGVGQGAGLFGLGVLVDRAGSDQYKAALFAQGFAFTNGGGLLLDTQGDDTYFAGGTYKSDYPDDPKDVFSGKSQGYAMGTRSSVQLAGGVAALVDVAGNDTYDAGNFSQAGGYFFSLGMIRDLAGNDQYTGTRYSQGFGVHQAVGILMDDKGNDRYTCRRTANIGTAWDLSSGYFIDSAGNDTYRTDGGVLIEGSAAQNGFAFFLDAAGTDSYLGSPPGSAQGNEYGPPGFSLGIFLDCGGGRDTYKNARKNNSLFRDEGKKKKFGLFADIRNTLSRARHVRFAVRRR